MKNKEIKLSELHTKMLAILAIKPDDFNWDEFFEPMIGQDPNKEPDMAILAIFHILDRTLYSSGLRRELQFNVMGMEPDANMRQLFLYITHLVIKPTDEEIQTIKNAINQDNDYFEANDDEEDD